MCGYYLKGSEVLTQYTEDGCNMINHNVFFYFPDYFISFSDMRFGRNVARTIFEYYRFTNVLVIPMYTELSTRKGRPKTHRPRTRRRISPEVKPRPKTTRTNAPISYNDLSIRYESCSSNEGSPVRYGGHHGYGFGTRQTGNIYMNNDQFSLLAIQASKFNQLDFSSEFKSLPKIKTAQTVSSHMRTIDTTVTVAPKPCLSIIDFNQITRGGLEKATRRSDEAKGKGKM